MANMRIAFLLACIAATTWAHAAAAYDWKSYRYPDDGFVVDFPAAPKVANAPLSPAQWVRGKQYSANFSTVAFFAQAFLYKPDIRAKVAPDDLLRVAIDGASQAGTCASKTESELSFPGAIAREVIFDKCGGDFRVKMRLVLIADWLYSVYVVGNPGVENDQDTSRFLDSFNLVSDR